MNCMTMKRATQPQRHRSAMRLCGVALLWLSLAAHAHDVDHDTIPAASGWRLDASAAVAAISANTRWPAARWSGLLGSGRGVDDQRGLKLEHATVGAAARFAPWLGLELAAGLHPGGEYHVEAARLELQWPGALPAIGGALRLNAGRERVPLGPVLTGAGHMDRFALAPVAKQVMLDGDWIDDGARLQWQPGAPDADGLRRVDVGLWKGRTFPGGPAGRTVPSAGITGGWGDWTMHVSAATWTPSRRGSIAAGSTSTGHSHSVPDCATSLTGVVCLDGRSTLYSASVQWAPDDQPFQIRAASLWQRESGQLYGASGDVSYLGRSQGGWVDLIWTPQERWELSARLERVSARQQLSGAGAATLAAAAGLTNNTPVSRQALALSHEPASHSQLSLEVGHERHAGPSLRWVGLRWIWHGEPLLSGSW